MNWITMLFASGAVAMVSGSRSGLPQKKMKSDQVVREGSFELDTSAERALQFFTPEGERSWVKGWDPKPLYPPQAGVVFQANSVFSLDHQGEGSLWTIVAADVQEHIAEYICVVEGERFSRVRVHIQPLGADRCRVHVQYVHTATSVKGRQFVAHVTEQVYAQKMRDWQRLVSAAIR